VLLQFDSIFTTLLAKNCNNVFEFVKVAYKNSESALLPNTV